MVSSLNAVIKSNHAFTITIHLLYHALGSIVDDEDVFVKDSSTRVLLSILQYHFTGGSAVSFA